jgi:glucokinase
MHLGIEIGGTKLQLGVGPGDGSPLAELQSVEVDPQGGAEGIRRQLEAAGRPLLARHDVAAIGIGFGGPVDAAAGRTIASHQIHGWNDFALVDWCRQTFGLPAALGNDSDCAGLAEARFGAGRGHRIVFYSNVGSGIGGALVIDGELYRGASGVASEIGHLRPGLQADWPDHTVESIASGWAIADAVRSKLAEPVSHSLESIVGEGRPSRPDEVRQRLIDREESDERDAGDLLERCDGRVEMIDTKMIAVAAAEGNELARSALEHACTAYAWAIAQMITLLAPDVVVIGGGVAQIGEDLFFSPLRKQVRRYVFPPLADRFQIVASKFGQEVVVQGALAIATEAPGKPGR